VSVEVGGAPVTDEYFKTQSIKIVLPTIETLFSSVSLKHEQEQVNKGELFMKY